MRRGSVFPGWRFCVGAARSLKAAGIEANRAEAIAGVMGQSHNQLVTVEHFDARIDAVRTELRGEIMRAQFVSVGIIIAAMALMMTILGMVLTARRAVTVAQGSV